MTMRSNAIECRLRYAFDKALDALGPSSKKATLYYLVNYYGLDLSSPQLSIEQIEKALSSLLGVGSTIIVSRIYQELDALSSCGSSVIRKGTTTTAS